ncbi:hypothetical protein LEP1GSC061_3504 [Leptospira wolffii serovar Khorat str. Khorat-H2]|nr:hypothetical protein LEP1GSC061_3504 [Leptospira wolffii serovar Khorat str. Khorat-H2]
MYSSVKIDLAKQVYSTSQFGISQIRIKYRSIEKIRSYGFR